MVVPNLFAGNQIEKGEHRWTWCYLHGKAEDLFPEGTSAPDIFMADVPMPKRAGSYPVLINGVKGIAIIARPDRKRFLEGRVVLIDDFTGLQHACKPEDWR